VLRLLTEVRKYAEFHFYSEENIMLDAEYPEYAKHKEEHEVLLANLDYHFHQYRLGASNLDEVVDFMFNWFALHTTGSDKKLAGYIECVA
jgi:hemerythrin